MPRTAISSSTLELLILPRGYAAKARALLAAYPLGKIKSSSVEELMAVRGIGRADAERIYEYFRKNGKKK